MMKKIICCTIPRTVNCKCVCDTLNVSYFFSISCCSIIPVTVSLKWIFLLHAHTQTTCSNPLDAWMFATSLTSPRFNEFYNWKGDALISILPTTWFYINVWYYRRKKINIYFSVAVPYQPLGFRFSIIGQHLRWKRHWSISHLVSNLDIEFETYMKWIRDEGRLQPRVIGYKMKWWIPGKNPAHRFLGTYGNSDAVVLN